MIDIWLPEYFWEEAATFLLLVLGSLGIALLIGLPLGIALTRLRRVSGPVIAGLARPERSATSSCAVRQEAASPMCRRRAQQVLNRWPGARSPSEIYRTSSCLKLWWTRFGRKVFSSECGHDSI